MKRERVFVVGATGEIGSGVVRGLVKNDVNATAYVRDERKAQDLFGDELNSGHLSIDHLRTTIDREFLSNKHWLWPGSFHRLRFPFVELRSQNHDAKTPQLCVLLGRPVRRLEDWLRENIRGVEEGRKAWESIEQHILSVHCRWYCHRIWHRKSVLSFRQVLLSSAPKSDSRRSSPILSRRSNRLVSHREFRNESTRVFLSSTARRFDISSWETSCKWRETEWIVEVEWRRDDIRRRCPKSIHPVYCTGRRWTICVHLFVWERREVANFVSLDWIPRKGEKLISWFLDFWGFLVLEISFYPLAGVRCTENFVCHPISICTTTIISRPISTWEISSASNSSWMTAFTTTCVYGCRRNACMMWDSHPTCDE